MARRVDRGKERLWRRRVERFRRSGMKVRAFCVAEQLKESAFHWWRRELAWRDRERAVDGASEGRRRGGRRSAATFVPVRVVGESSTDVEIVVRGGRVVRVRPGFDGPALLQVIALLEGAAC